jgi:hypothetical protein
LLQTTLPSGANISVLVKVYDRFDGVNSCTIRRINVTACTASVLLSLVRKTSILSQSGRLLNNTQFYQALAITAGEGGLLPSPCMCFQS